MIPSPGNHPPNKLGAGNLQHNCASTHCVWFFDNIPNIPHTLHTIHVDGWDDFWIRLRFSPDHCRSACWRLYSVFYWFTILSKDPCKGISPLNILLVWFFLCSIISIFIYLLLVGVVRKAPKESFYHKVSRRGQLV